jgi:hypothetical protein
MAYLRALFMGSFEGSFRRIPVVRFVFGIMARKSLARSGAT